MHAACSKAEAKIFAPLQTPFLGVQDDQNLISWRWSLPLLTNQVWWGSMHAISSYHGNRPTNKQRQPTCCKHADRTDNNNKTLSLVRSVISCTLSLENVCHHLQGCGDVLCGIHYRPQTGWYLLGATCPGHWISRYGTKWPSLCWCATASRSYPPHWLYLQSHSFLIKNSSKHNQFLLLLTFRSL